MSRNLTLGKRIAFGIFIMLVLMAVVGAAGYFGLTRVLKVNDFNQAINRFQMTVASVNRQTDRYLLAAYIGQKALSTTCTYWSVDRMRETKRMYRMAEIVNTCLSLTRRFRS